MPHVVVSDELTLWIVVSTDQVCPVVSEVEIGERVRVIADQNMWKMSVQYFGHLGHLGRHPRLKAIEVSLFSHGCHRSCCSPPHSVSLHIHLPVDQAMALASSSSSWSSFSLVPLWKSTRNARPRKYKSHFSMGLSIRLYLCLQRFPWRSSSDHN